MIHEVIVSHSGVPQFSVEVDTLDRRAAERDVWLNRCADRRHCAEDSYEAVDPQVDVDEMYAVVASMYRLSPGFAAHVDAIANGERPCASW